MHARIIFYLSGIVYFFALESGWGARASAAAILVGGLACTVWARRAPQTRVTFLILYDLFSIAGIPLAMTTSLSGWSAQVLSAPAWAATFILLVLNTAPVRFELPCLFGLGATLIHGLGLVWISSEGSALGSERLFAGFAIYTLLFASGLLAGYARLLRSDLDAEAEHQRARWAKERLDADLAIQRRIETLSHFVAGILHELNSPLGVIKSGAQTYEKALARLHRHGADDRRARLALDTQLSAHLQAVERINGFLNSLEGMTGLDHSELQTVDTRQAVEEACRQVRASNPSPPDIHMELDDAPQVVGRASALGLSLEAVLKNAVEATRDAGAVWIRVRPDVDGVRIDVVDTGRGMTPSELSRLFEPRLDRRGSRVALRGLGLLMARQCLESGGGRLEIESVRGQGTRVSLFFAGRATQQDGSR